MPIPQNADESECIRIEMEKYQKTGMIGNTHPNNITHAQQIASAACYNRKQAAPAEPVV